MSNSSVPVIAFAPTGPVIPVESAILAGVQADMNAAFGGNLNPSLTTPQGQLATSLAAIIANKNAEIAYYLNQTDPATASGRRTAESICSATPAGTSIMKASAASSAARPSVRCGIRCITASR